MVHEVSSRMDAKYHTTSNKYHCVRYSNTLVFNYMNNQNEVEKLFLKLKQSIGPYLQNKTIMEKPKLDITWSPSLMQNEKGTDLQMAHIDYSQKLLTNARHSVQNLVGTDVPYSSVEYYDKYNCFMPFLGFMPLTLSGMYLQVWPDRRTFEEYNKETKPYLVKINLGEMLVLQGNTVHAGGIDDGTGCNRVHFYFHKKVKGLKTRGKSQTMVEPTLQQNSYMDFAWAECDQKLEEEKKMKQNKRLKAYVVEFHHQINLDIVFYILCSICMVLFDKTRWYFFLYVPVCAITIVVVAQRMFHDAIKHSWPQVARLQKRKSGFIGFV